MSVTPDDPMQLPLHRKPPSLNGTGYDPVWKLSSSDIPDKLTLRATRPTHCLVEPKEQMMLNEYVAQLATTQPDWVMAYA